MHQLVIKINKTHNNDPCGARWAHWTRWTRWTCPGDKHELGNEHPGIYATIESTSLH